MGVVLALIYWLKKIKTYFDGFKSQIKGLDSADGTSFPNSFYDFEFKLLHFRKETQ